VRSSQPSDQFLSQEAHDIIELCDVMGLRCSICHTLEVDSGLVSVLSACCVGFALKLIMTDNTGMC
jgi:hypothetical protein